MKLFRLHYLLHEVSGSNINGLLSLSLLGAIFNSSSESKLIQASMRGDAAKSIYALTCKSRTTSTCCLSEALDLLLPQALPRLPIEANNGTTEFCSLNSGEAFAVSLHLAPRPLPRLSIKANNGTTELCSLSSGEAFAVFLDLAPRPLPRLPVLK
ncbi:hypothetical protein GQX74_014802 [Glossina fuscipes]|nr:hypothetical protein GQX74_014802 [Glossina fuscipes]